MCGLIGVIGDDAAVTHGWGSAMEAIRRRGPDGEGSWASPSGVARLGHTRLAVRDLSDAGAQPMVSKDGRSVMVYNGEIYNARELRDMLEREGVRFRGHSDTEILLEGLIAWGIDRLLTRLVGIFAFALWDDRSRELVAAVDHAGVKPLVWSYADGKLVFASDCDSARTLLEGEGRSVSLDSVGLRSVLTFGYCPAPRTVWDGIRKLAPGTMLRWSHGHRPVVDRWWRPPDPREKRDNERVEIPGTSGDKNADSDWFARAWPGVLASECVSDRPMGLFLSSGLDSVSVAAGVAEAGGAPLCLTIGMAEDDESARAASIAERLGLSHRVIPMESRTLEDELDLAGPVFDEPQGFSALLSQRALCSAAAGERAVLLSGDGGDELLAGYAWHRPDEIEAIRELTRRTHLVADAAAMESAIAQPDADDQTRRRSLGAQGAAGFAAAWALRIFPGFHFAEAAALTPELDGRPGDATHGADLRERLFAPFADADRHDLGDLDRVRRLDLACFCGGSILPKVDRASMWHGLEVRTPFLQRHLLETGLARAGMNAGKQDLRAYLGSRGLLDSVNPRKQGFSVRGVGTAEWRQAAERLASSRLVRSGVVRPDWDRFIPRGDHLEQLRLQVLCLVAAWAETRL